MAAAARSPERQLHAGGGLAAHAAAGGAARQLDAAAGQCPAGRGGGPRAQIRWPLAAAGAQRRRSAAPRLAGGLDRKSTRLNSSHLVISYAVFCLKKKKKTT